GCASHSLGVMRYRLVCTPAYARKWFPHGLEREAARVAPLLVFDRKDDMPADYLQRELGLPPGSYPCFYVPSSDAFVTEARLGLGYGLVPELQCTALIKRGTLIDLAPAKPVDVHLYWHAWRVQSPKMERLSAQVVAAARKVLRRPSTRRGAASALTA
ncbi:MAG: LysR substrate-binding domain-containing protein, partial [Massilia sp.]